ncbi:hatching enzyme 1.2 [Anabrus simplex]|uniref:hatching enzyme 1.2 n=1 Tax=Anabrus simplex TaxID=316456 RepID=UPI0034DCE076
MKLSCVILIQAFYCITARRRAVPPDPMYRGQFEEEFPRSEIADQVSTWTPQERGNAWEMSGLFEGDIMLSDDSDIRNAIQDEERYWPNGIVPYYINEKDFSKEDIATIKEALDEYHDKTCIKFRPYKKTDSDYVMVLGNKTGCWSYVGRHGRGQVINLQNPGCVHHGIVVHEFLHALGFYHQQSAHNRDEYIKVHWENIKTGREHNFKKYNASTVTDFNVGYDYGSVMHYSAYAFSKNGQPTLEPLDKNAVIGQRKGLSKKDVAKLKVMYGCKDESYSPYWPFQA